jgi:hypothetical protein
MEASAEIQQRTNPAMHTNSTVIGAIDPGQHLQ